MAKADMDRMVAKIRVYSVSLRDQSTATRPPLFLMRCYQGTNTRCPSAQNSLDSQGHSKTAKTSKAAAGERGDSLRSDFDLNQKLMGTRAPHEAAIMPHFGWARIGVQTKEGLEEGSPWEGVVQLSAIFMVRNSFRVKFEQNSKRCSRFVIDLNGNPLCLIHILGSRSSRSRIPLFSAVY